SDEPAGVIPAPSVYAGGVRAVSSWLVPACGRLSWENSATICPPSQEPHPVNPSEILTVGQGDVLEQILAAVFTRGHVLLIDAGFQPASPARRERAATSACQHELSPLLCLPSRLAVGHL